MENKNFFESWMETQKQMMENWSESNRKLQASIQNGTVMSEGTSIYQDWLNKQQEITKQAADQAGETFRNQVNEAGKSFGNPSVADTYQNWMKSQQEAATKAFENFKSMYNPTLFSANNDYTKQFQNMHQAWMENSKQWMDNYMKPFSAMNNPFADWSKSFNNDAAKSAWNNMTNVNDTYFRFMEMWKPVWDNMKSNQFSAEWFRTSFNPEMFRQLMDKTIEWASPSQAKEWFSQFQNWNEMSNNYFRHSYEQFMNSMPESVKTLAPYLFMGNPDANNNIFSFYQRAVMPVFNFFNPGKEAEAKEMMVAIMEKSAVYGQKLTEMQQFLNVTGAKAWENFVLENFEEMKKGTDMSNTQQAFQKWLNRSEEAFISAFRGDEYSKLQAELLDLGLEIRQKQEKLQELLLANTPVVLRSEATDLYETIYELRKRIYALEKQLGDNENKEVKSSGKKKAATV